MNNRNWKLVLFKIPLSCRRGLKKIFNKKYTTRLKLVAQPYGSHLLHTCRNKNVDPVMRKKWTATSCIKSVKIHLYEMQRFSVILLTCSYFSSNLSQFREYDKKQYLKNTKLIVCGISYLIKLIWYSRKY